VLNPRQFFNQFVMPCVTDWQLDPLNIRKAVIAISQIDILADHVILHQHPDFTTRDVHDTHKHGPLQRPTATITTGERPKLERHGGVFDPRVFQNNVFQVGTPVLEIVQDDGTKHLVENVITDALTYWEGELVTLGL
jgi:hypothetical protein